MKFGRSLKSLSFSSLVTALEASGEATRLRLLVLLSEAELTVSELVNILGQSQPRVSRHLRLLTEAGLIERHREGSWAFFQLATSKAVGGLAHDIIRRVDRDDPVFAGDQARLKDVRLNRTAQASRYFAEQAQNWDLVRAMHVSEARVESAIKLAVGSKQFQTLLDLGTGTGRMLELLAPLAERSLGIDQSTAMLNLARTRVERAGLKNTQVRQGDLYALPVAQNSFDLVVLHQVLHFLDDPHRALREAIRTLKPSGRLLVVDFAPHNEESLRTEHAHRRLGFENHEIVRLLEQSGLAVILLNNLLPSEDGQDKLSVTIWLAQDQRVVSDIVYEKTLEVVS